MTRLNEVDLPLLHKGEVVAVASFLIVHQVHHLLLGKRGEKQTEFNLVVAVGGIEKSLELAVRHHGEVTVSSLYVFSSLLFDFLDCVLLAPVVHHAVAESGEV